jgi:hypothetical protein
MTDEQIAALVEQIRRTYTDDLIDALEAENERLREALGRLGKAGQAVTETFTTRDVLLEYEGSQEFGLMPDYGTVGKEVAQELMAALNYASAALAQETQP